MDKNKRFINNLKHLINTHAEGNAARFARKAGISSSTIKSWLGGRARAVGSNGLKLQQISGYALEDIITKDLTQPVIEEYNNEKNNTSHVTDILSDLLGFPPSSQKRILLLIKTAIQLATNE